MSADLHGSVLFLGLVLLFSLPFLLLPGDLPGGLPLPGSALTALVPMLAALAAARVTEGRAGVRRAMAPVTGWRVRHGWWWLALAGAMPLVLVASAGVVLLARGAPGAGTVDAAPATVVVLMAGVFLLSGLTEQLGWTGFLQPLWQPWLGRLGSALAIGVLWGLWHVPGYVQAGRGAGWVAGQVAFTVALRVVIQELTDASGGAVPAAAVVQAGSNTAWLALPPDVYVPAAAALLTSAAAAALVGGRLLRPANHSAGALAGRTERGRNP